MKDKEITPGSMASYDGRASSRSYHSSDDDYSTYGDDFEDGDSLQTRSRSRSPVRTKSPLKDIKRHISKSQSNKKSK